MRVPQELINEILDRLSIVDVAKKYVALEPRGGRFWGLCPFHTEKTASFTVSEERAAFYCFGCNRGGGLVQFVMDVEQLGFREAIELLAERAGVDLRGVAGGGGGEAGVPRHTYVDLCNRLAGTFHHLFLTGAEASAARSYVAGRGIDKKAVERFRIGWAPRQAGWLHRFLRNKNYSDEFLLQSGLFVQRDGQIRAIFWGRVMFPISNARGEVIAFGGRSLEEGGPKYVNSAESAMFRKAEQLYGLDLALTWLRDHDEGSTPAATSAGRTNGAVVSPTALPDSTVPTVAVVEGYTDVIALASIGVPAVAPLGTAFGSHHARLMKRHGLSALLAYDADAAGSAAALRSLHELIRQEVPTGVVELPAGADPADIVAAGNGDELHERLKSPITSFQYIIATTTVGKDLRTPEGKEHTFREIHPFVQDVESVITREALLQELALQLGVDFDVARQEYARLTGRGTDGRARHARTPRVQESAAPSAAGPEVAELRLMLAIAVNREFFKDVRNQISAEDLGDKDARGLFIALEDCFRRGEDDTDSVAGRLEPESLRRLFLQKLASDEFTDRADTYIASGVQQIRIGALGRRREEILVRLRHAERDQAEQEVSELLADKIHLDSELERLRREPVLPHEPRQD